MQNRLMNPSLRYLAAAQFINQFDHIQEIEELISTNSTMPVFYDEGIKPILEKILTHINLFQNRVIRGRQKEAEEIIEQTHPLLWRPFFSLKGSVIDYSNRRIEGTALQLALGAEDIKYHDNEECMVEMLLKYLRRLPNGKALIAEQIHEQFPSRWQQQDYTKSRDDRVALQQVFNVITQSRSIEECKAALQIFRNYLEQPNQSIFRGKHFNIQLLIEACRLYKDICINNATQIMNDNRDKYQLLWLVIGTIQRHLPANYAQALSQGLYNIVERKEPLQRTLKLRNEKYDVYFYPLDSDPTNRLGYDYACLAATRFLFNLGAMHMVEMMCDSLTQYAEKKSLRIQNIIGEINVFQPRNNNASV